MGNFLHFCLSIFILFQKMGKKNKKKFEKKNHGMDDGNDSILQDSRFSKIQSDPRFKRMNKNETKLKVDKRFNDMFTKDSFKNKYKIDKYGRKIKNTTADDMKKFYRID